MRPERANTKTPIVPHNHRGHFIPPPLCSSAPQAFAIDAGAHPDAPLRSVGTYKHGSTYRVAVSLRARWIFAFGSGGKKLNTSCIREQAAARRLHQRRVARFGEMRVQGAAPRRPGGAQRTMAEPTQFGGSNWRFN